MVLSALTLSACSNAAFRVTERESLFKNQPVFGTTIDHDSEVQGDAEAAVTGSGQPTNGASGGVNTIPSPTNGTGGSLPSIPGGLLGTIGSVVTIPSFTGGTSGGVPTTSSGSSGATGGPAPGTVATIPSGAGSASGGLPTLPSSASGGVPTSSSSASGAEGSVTPTNLPSVGPTEIPFGFLCSRSQMDRSQGVALANADYLEVVLKDLGDASVCVDNDSTLLSDLRNNKTIDFAKVYTRCQAKSSAFNTVNAKELHINGALGAKRATFDNSEGITTYVVAKVGDYFKMANSTYGSGPNWSSYENVGTHVTTSGGGRLGRSASYFQDPFVFFDGRPSGSSSGNAVTDGKACDYELSPLVIRIGENSGPIDLTAPWNGRLFDILGLNSFPFAHAKKKISWFSHAADYFLTLPNARGEVNGIDELFGNNTSGPDGRFAANGYAALAKYDRPAADGIIDQRDAIFSRLRLWRDVNLDAIAQFNELHRLSEFGIVAIDLDYDESFVERDRYGNETRMKSSVRTAEGKLHLMYDLWFSRAAIDGD